MDRTVDMACIRKGLDIISNTGITWKMKWLLQELTA